jgi:general secretion pathway protein J
MMLSRPRWRGNEQGMTLVELLVGLSLLSLIALMLAGGLHLGTRVWETSANRLSQGDRLERSDSFLRQLLAQMRIRFDDLAAGSPRGFLGDPDKLAFLAPLPEQFGGGDVYSFELGDGTGDVSSSLMLRWQPMAPGAGKNASGEAMLIDRMQAARFAYYGKAAGEAAASWHDEWSGHSGLPVLIRLTLTRLAQPGGDDTTLYFAPALAGGG